MFYLDGILLSKYKKTLESALINRKISQIIQYDARNFFFVFNKIKLTLSLAPDFPILYLTDTKENSQFDTPFSLSLKKHLQGAILRSIDQIHCDRILILEFSRISVLGHTETHYLVFEMISKMPNLILLDSEKKVLFAYKFIPLEANDTRVLLPGFYYKSLESHKLSPWDIDETRFEALLEKPSLMHHIDGMGKYAEAFISKDFKNFQTYLTAPLTPIFVKDPKPFASFFDFFSHRSDASTSCDQSAHGKSSPQLDLDVLDSETLFSTYFSQTRSQDSFSKQHDRLKKAIDKQANHTKTILKKITKDLKSLENIEKFKERADILAANMYQIPSYVKTVTLYNFYENCEEEIVLDEKKNAKKNIDAYYALFTKKKRALQFMLERQSTLETLADYIQTLYFSLTLATTLEDLKGISEELIAQNFIKPAKSNLKKNKKKPSENSGVIEHVAENYTIYVGKNNLANEKITFSLARKNDLWFHVQGMPSAHVVLTMQNQLPFSKAAIFEAATLCKQYSKAKESAQVTVDYTEKKHVRKQKNYKPCLVFYTDFKSIIV